MNKLLGSNEEMEVERVYRYGMEKFCDISESADMINKFFATVGERIMEDLSSVHYKTLDSIRLQYLNADWKNSHP